MHILNTKILIKQYLQILSLLLASADITADEITYEQIKLLFWLIFSQKLFFATNIINYIQCCSILVNVLLTRFKVSKSKQTIVNFGELKDDLILSQFLDCSNNLHVSGCRPRQFDSRCCHSGGAPPGVDGGR